MKKQRLNVLTLNKEAISSFDPYKVIGGYSHSNAQNGTREYCCYPM